MSHTNSLNTVATDDGPTTDPSERLLNDADLCQRWGWKSKTPAVLRARGRFPIPFIRLGTRVRYRLSDIIAHENANTVQPKVKPEPATAA